MRLKLHELVMVSYWDHTSSMKKDESKPELMNAPGWISEIGRGKPAFIVVSHSRGEAEDDFEFPYTVILTSDIVKVRSLKK